MNRPHSPSRYPALLLLLLLVLPLVLMAATASPAQPAPPPPAAPTEPAAAGSPSLPAWDALTPAQREQLTATLRDRWNNAAPDERARMLARAGRWQQLPPRQRVRISGAMGRWQGMPPGEHRELRALFHALTRMPDGERTDFLRRWAGMSAAERQAWVEAHPAPPHEDGPRHRLHPPGHERTGHGHHPPPKPQPEAEPREPVGLDLPPPAQQPVQAAADAGI